MFFFRYYCLQRRRKKRTRDVERMVTCMPARNGNELQVVVNFIFTTILSEKRERKGTPGLLLCFFYYIYYYAHGEQGKRGKRKNEFSRVCILKATLYENLYRIIIFVMLHPYNSGILGWKEIL